MAKVELISQADYARHRGVSEAAVSKAVKERRITLIDGRIDPVVADVQWARNSRVRAHPGRRGVADRQRAGSAVTESAGRDVPADDPVVEPVASVLLIDEGETAGAVPGAGSDTAGDLVSPDYNISRARREAAEAAMAEIALRRKRGELIEVSAVEAIWAAALVAVRDHLLQLCARLAPVLAVETDVSRIEHLLDQDHAAALRHMSDATIAPAAGTVQ